MIRRISHVMIVVTDVDRALRFYTEQIGLAKRLDETLESGLRWVTVGPESQPEMEIALCRGDPGVRSRSTDGKPIPIATFRCDDCPKLLAELSERGVDVVAGPREETYGTEGFFADPDGNVFSIVDARRRG